MALLSSLIKLSLYSRESKEKITNRKEDSRSVGPENYCGYGNLRLNWSSGDVLKSRKVALVTHRQR